MKLSQRRSIKLSPTKTLFPMTYPAQPSHSTYRIPLQKHNKSFQRKSLVCKSPFRQESLFTHSLSTRKPLQSLFHKSHLRKALSQQGTLHRRRVLFQTPHHCPNSNEIMRQYRQQLKHRAMPKPNQN